MRAGVDLIGDAMHRAVAEHYVKSRGMGAAESPLRTATGAIIAVGRGVIVFFRASRIRIPSHAVIVPLIARVHRLVVTGRKTRFISSGRAFVSGDRHPLFANEVGFRSAVVNLTGLERTTVI